MRVNVVGVFKAAEGCDAVLSGRFTGSIFEDRRCNDAAVC